MGWIVGIIIAAVIVFFIWAGVADGNNWTKFSAQHHCQLTAHTDGHWIYGFGGKYSQSYYQNGQDTYKCDNGVSYTRDN